MEMFRVIATDVDGVVKPYYDPVPRELSETLIKISNLTRIVFLSGRQISWLEGLVNGMGLDVNRTILIGEEGAVILFPETYRVVYSVDKEVLGRFKLAREEIKRSVLREFGMSVFIPATHVILTIAAGKYFSDVDTLVKKIISRANYGDIIDLTYHKMHNVIQVFPKGVNKYAALRIVLRTLGISEEEVIALGDGLNDIPMLEHSALAIAIGNNPEVKKHASLHFNDGLSAFKYIINNLASNLA